MPRKPKEPPARQDKVTETLVAGSMMPVLGPVPAQAPRKPITQPLAAAVPSCSEPGSARDDETDTGPIDAALIESALAGTGVIAAAQNPDAAITALFGAHYRPLVRLAVLLVHDVATAEEVVQDSFVALHSGLHRLRDNEKALAYLRTAVVNRSRSVLRHRVVVDRNAPKPPPDMPSAEHGALALLERSAVVSALRKLPVRQREVVVLRFYGDLSEAQIASTMGITRGAVKSHTSRAMSALRSVLERQS
jgi:RNA polymerase sigma-70 factor (sigma-E family)